jgi:hypothetical protein
MAKDVEVNLNVNNNIQGSIAELKQLKRQLKDTEVGTEAFKNLFNQIDDLEDKIKSAKNTSSDWVDTLEMAGGPLGMLGGAINKAKVATQSFSGALKASGIGLLVSLVGGLVAAFNDSEKATKKLQPLFIGLEKIFNGVYSAVEPLFNILVDLAISALPLVSKAMQTVYGSVTAVVQSLGSLGSAVAKFVKGDFSGAWKSAKASVTDFGKNYDQSIKRFQEGSKELTKTEKEESDKRKKERDEAALKNEEEWAKQYEKNEALLKAYYEKELEAYNNRSEKLKKLNTGYLEDSAIQAKNFSDANLKNLTNKIDAEIAAEKKKKDESVATTQTEFDTKMSIQEAYIENVMRLGQGLRQIAGDNKELAIAGIILEQSAAVAKIALNAKANFVKNGGVTNPLAWVGLAGDVAAGLSAVQAARKGIQDIQSGTASSGQMSFGNAQMTPSYQAAPRFNVVGVNPMNQAAQAFQSTGPIKTYVVASDVTTAQALDRNKITSATLG